MAEDRVSVREDTNKSQVRWQPTEREVSDRAAVLKHALHADGSGKSRKGRARIREEGKRKKNP